MHVFVTASHWPLAQSCAPSAHAWPCTHVPTGAYTQLPLLLPSHVLAAWHW